jgi:hypothetical protein
MYRYHSITGDSQSFRILKVHGSSSRESLVECELIESRLGQAEYAYEAISYCWNTGVRNRSVLCDGETLPVTESCEAVLRRFRYPTKSRSRLLWIDFICINQAEMDERTHQVTLMGRIYAKAKCVLIWLGEEAENDSGKEGFGWLMRLANAASVPDLESRKNQVLELAFELNNKGKQARLR